MRLLYEFDAGDYAGLTRRSVRSAVRSIIFRDGRIAMVFSPKEGYYKFPGGGVEEHESHAQALVRETAEETGLTVVPSSIREFGKIHEIRRSTHFEDEIFDHTSYYYRAQVEEGVARQRLDPYEAELGFQLAYVEPRQAYDTNRVKGRQYRSSFILREAKVLELLLAETK